MSPQGKFLALLASAFLCAASAHATPAVEAIPKGMTKVTATDGITEYRLANGLKVLLFPDAAKPTVTVNVTYLVGSRFENYGETGMAHLLEHMMFKGTPRHPAIDQDFNNRGMQSNGSTWIDRTNFYEVFPAGDDNLKWALDMEADRMVNSNIARKDLDSEMTVVRNEFESGENSPSGVMLKRMQSVAFDWHSYGKATIGNRSDIENVGIDNLRAFYRLYYQPDNAVLLIAGKFEPTRTLQWVANAFGKLPKPKRARPLFWTVEPTQDGERCFTVRRAGDIQIVEVGYKVPSALHPDSDALSFAAEILSDTPNGRLYKQLVEPGLAAQVFSQDLSGVAPGLQMLGAVVRKGQPIEPARDALLAAVENFYKQPPTPEEMARVVRNESNQIEKMLNDPQEVGIALSDVIALGDWRLLFHGRAMLQKITAEQVAAVSAKYFRRDNRTLGEFIPEDQAQRAEIPVAPAVTEVMKEFVPSRELDAAETFDPSQANIEARTQLSHVGGLQLALLPKKNRGQTVSVALQLHWGDEKSLFGKQTISGLTAEMLLRGNAQYTREQLADQMARLKMNGDPYHFETTRANLSAALRLAAQILKQPTFPEKEFEQLRNEILVGLESSRNDPRTLAEQAIAEHFDHYPAGDWRAAESIDQQIAAVKATTLEQVKAFHHEFYGASHGEIAIVGDFDPAEAAKALDETLLGWNSAAPYALVKRTIADIAPIHKKLDAPDKENGFYTAHVELDLSDTDDSYPALALANYIFGGGAGLDSRLMARIRKKDGLSYGGESSLDPGTIDRAGSFSISAIAAPQNLNKLDVAVAQELQRVLKSGFTAEEVARAKSGMLQQRAQTRAQDGAVAYGWITYLYLGRTFAWSKAYEDKIRALTPEQVTAAFRKVIDPAKLSVAIAGDAKKERK
ncbi:MAG TPA: pitrilysin family protein [Burkholderiaceae bacterium]|jgi:zinc protease